MRISIRCGAGACSSAPPRRTGCGSRGEREPHASSASPAASTIRPTIARADSRSSSTVMPRMLAVSGSPRVSVAAVAAVSPLSPHVNSTYAIEIVAMPSHSAITSPLVVASHARSTNGRTNADSTAALAPIAPTTVNGSHPASSSRRCAFAITANDAPAPTEPSRPIGSVPPAPPAAASPPKPSRTTPAVASAGGQHPGRRRARDASAPTRAGRRGSAPTRARRRCRRPRRCAAVPRKNSGW